MTNLSMEMEDFEQTPLHQKDGDVDFCKKNKILYCCKKIIQEMKIIQQNLNAIYNVQRALIKQKVEMAGFEL